MIVSRRQGGVPLGPDARYGLGKRMQHSGGKCVLTGKEVYLSHLGQREYVGVLQIGQENDVAAPPRCDAATALARHLAAPAAVVGGVVQRRVGNTGHQDLGAGVGPGEIEEHDGLWVVGARGGLCAELIGIGECAVSTMHLMNGGCVGRTPPICKSV